MLDLATLERLANEDVAAMMVTNPNTVGVFEENIQRRRDTACKRRHGLHGRRQHERDGGHHSARRFRDRRDAPQSAQDVLDSAWRRWTGRRSGSGEEALEPFLPVPRLRRIGDAWTLDHDRKESIGKVRAFVGNFGVLIRALAYIMAHGGPGLRLATLDAILNANYIRKALEPYFDLPYNSPSMHEAVFSDDRQAAKGVRTGDIAKRLIDYGFHPYTTSFPLIVHGR
jgi:glycine dehydrogenase subunit 2